MSKKRPPFTIIETAVIYSEQLTWSEKRVYIALKSFRRNSPPTQCKPGQEKIMRRAGVDKTTYLKARDKLKIYGLIKFESSRSEKTGAGPGRGKTINYDFPFEDGTEEEEQRLLAFLKVKKKGVKSNRLIRRDKTVPNSTTKKILTGVKQRLLAFLKVKKKGVKSNRFRRKKTGENDTVLSQKNGINLHQKTVSNDTTIKKVLTRSNKEQQQQGKTKKPDVVASFSHEKGQKPKPVVKDNDRTASLIAKLKELGITEDKAVEFLATHLYENVEKQIEWLPYRKGIRNPAGALIKAVEQDWPEPVTRGTGTKRRTEETLKYKRCYTGYWESQEAMFKVAKEDLKKGAGPGRVKEWLDKLDPDYHEKLKEFVRGLNKYKGVYE